MNIHILVQLSLSLDKAGSQANKDKGQEFHCVLGLTAFHDALFAHTEDCKSH